ncbi:MAG: transcriptional repressor NrdR [Clostridia bacterium]|nr:transcriptional repressor NrdR [Clostridia bacterium]
MKCRYCGSVDSKVIDSRPNEDGTAIRRRRECVSCGRRFTTFERIEENPVMVVKRDGRRELFEREKVATGIRKACEKRPIAADVQNKMVDRIVREVNNSLDSEVSTAQLGELVMEQLKQVDEVAYVRFASVYKEFKDTQTFMEELQRLLDENTGA